MRVLIAASEFPPGPGGIGTHAWELARGLAGLGWEVAALARQDYVTGEEAEVFRREQPFRVTELPRRRAARPVVLARWSREWEPDLLVASGDRVVYLTAWAGRGRPWVAVEHGRAPEGWERPVKRWALARASGVVAVSRFSWQQMEAMGVRPRAGRVIPNGADPERFRRWSEEQAQSVRRSLGLNGAPLVITVGNVSERKGQDVMIRALARLRGAHYLVVGLPTRRAEFETVAREAGVAGRVHFLGRVETDRLVGLLNASDVFVMTSRRAREQFEGYGIAVIEAALCGLPAVVTGESGLSEAVVDGETGLVAPPEDAAAVAAAVARLLDNEERRRAMGEAARRRALAEQTWGARVREYDQYFRSLLCSC
jgi:phosphatidylinositol alpha-1,6-mannosyltransferase